VIGVFFSYSNKSQVQRQCLQAIFLSIFGIGSKAISRKILLTTGVVDNLPNIQGMSQLWGRTVLNCPYCHGWEVRNEPLAVHGNGQDGLSLALTFNWSHDVVLCTNGPANLDEIDRKRLASKNIAIYEQYIDRLDYSEDKLESIIFTDGSFLERQALFVRPPQQQRSSLPSQLGCAFTETGKIKIDESGRTTVSDVYAAGDAVRMMQ
jgi:thioredoxin reductase